MKLVVPFHIVPRLMVLQCAVCCRIQQVLLKAILSNLYRVQESEKNRTLIR